MNDILIETCNYIYKNPGLTRHKYRKEMSERSIWRGVNIENEIEYMEDINIIDEKKRYSARYDRNYAVLEINLKEYIKFYNINFNDEIVLDILNYIFEHPKKSQNTYEKDFCTMFDDKELNKKYTECFLKLKNYGVLRLKTEYFNECKYYGLRIDFYQLKSFVISN